MAAFSHYSLLAHINAKKFRTTVIMLLIVFLQHIVNKK
jgi:hypothetical protein